MMLFIKRNKQEETIYEAKPEQWKTWGQLTAAIFIILALLALIAINSHGEVFGIQKRF
jgi:hypothetical protein